MGKKFGRLYKFSWVSESTDETINVSMPFTIGFTINRSTMASLNSAQFRIYNLNKTNRSKIFQDRFDIKDEERKTISFQAGYGKISTLFLGDAYEAYTYRQGTDIITFVDCRDGGIDSSGTLSNKTIQKNTDIKEVVNDLTSEFPNLKKGVFGEIDGSIKRPVVLDGNTFEIIKKYTNDSAFIDLGKVNVLKDNETITGFVNLINSESGLIGVPRRRGAFLEIETMFEPRIIMGQVLEVKSSVQPQYDGQYKVIGVNHSGIISPTMSGNCRSKFSLLIGSKVVGGFTNVE